VANSCPCYGQQYSDLETDAEIALLFAVHTFKLLHVMLFISGATFLGEQALLLLLRARACVQTGHHSTFV
jgi:hypothetical protein